MSSTLSRPLESFSERQSIPSATSKRLYEVLKVGDAWTCTCDFAKFHNGTGCRHALEAALRVVTAERDIAVDGYVNEALERFEEIVERMEFFRKPEFKRLGGLALSLALHHPGQTVWADDIQAATGGVFDGDSRIIGPVLRGLAKKGLLEHVGSRPTRRGHGRKIEVYRLTEAGKAVAEGAPVERA
jgi:hypothetical protein